MTFRNNVRIIISEQSFATNVRGDDMNTRNIERIKYERAVMRRRRAEVRRQKLILASVMITAILFLSFSAGARLAFAKSGGNNIRRVKQYKAVMINCGDNIGSISSRMYTDDFKDVDSFIHEIKVINHLDEDEELIAGNFLTIPYYIDHTAEYN